LRWIRLHYLYPNTVTPRLIETMARLPRVVKYVDLPLQHAHPATLARMRRGGSADSHLRLLERFRRAMPGVAIRTTMIVGFPGETDEEFSTLVDFLTAARFDHLGVFRYSHEEGTTAGGLEDDVPEDVKECRRDRLMELQREIVADHHLARVGQRVDVLVEGPHPETEHLLVGRMSTQALDVDGQVLINDGFARPGQIVPVELTEIAGYDLVGRVVDAA
ncbi:MAG: radical SAM protein, partial [Acidobacteriota bacterium]|nr:radical SAM protein [Acidobacteriota bacterium]